MMYRARTILCIGLLFLISTAKVLASEPLSSPTGRVLLSVSGNIKQHNSGDEALLDRQMLESLPQYQFTTETPWTEGPH